MDILIDQIFESEEGEDIIGEYMILWNVTLQVDIRHLKAGTHVDIVIIRDGKAEIYINGEGYKP